ncbi:MAG: glycosyltransferase family 39 protein [Candidatus Aceula meridiana]|nr:glycosyltransferase family 39 protein [Candidatus Aceula meridiana]
MINLFIYAISFFIGFLIIRSLKITKILSMPLCLALSIGLGLATCAIVLFFFLCIYGQFHQGFIISLNLLLLLTLSIIHIFYPPKQISEVSFTPPALIHPVRFYMIAVSLWIIFLSIIAILAQQYPYGGWDAWGLYNMKAKFILYGEMFWKSLATELHWHTQPSYPILLPLINSWIFSVFQTNLIRVASMTAIVFCAATGFLMYGGLSRFIRKELALLGSILLMSNHWWIFWSTTQYSDILLGYFLLANFILLTLLFKEKNKNLSFFTGIFLGLMTFAKNEGIVILILLSSLSSVYLFLDKTLSRQRSSQLIRWLLGGAVVGSVATLVFKLTMAPTTREVLFNPFTHELKYFNSSGILLTTKFYCVQFLSRDWNFIWIALGLVGILQFPKFFQKECKVFAIFFILYAFILIYVYISTAHFSLLWRLSCTASRIVANLLPSLIFFTFYTIWRKDD